MSTQTVSILMSEMPVLISVPVSSLYPAPMSNFRNKCVTHPGRFPHSCTKLSLIVLSKSNFLEKRVQDWVFHKLTTLCVSNLEVAYWNNREICCEVVFWYETRVYVVTHIIETPPPLSASKALENDTETLACTAIGTIFMKKPST